MCFVLLLPCAVAALEPKNCGGAGQGSNAWLYGNITQADGLKITSPGVQLPGDFESGLLAASGFIHDTWALLLGKPRVTRGRQELLLLADRFEFDDYRVNLAPNLNSVSGFYSPSAHLAVVRYDARTLEETRLTAIHELSHLVTYQQVGELPLWLAEGLAEYFETFRPGINEGATGLNRRHEQYLTSLPEGSLERLLNLGDAQWQGRAGRVHYALAWSLVDYLMTAGSGRKALSGLMSGIYEKSCKFENAGVCLGDLYPGGLKQLESDWLAHAASVAWTRGPDSRG